MNFRYKDYMWVDQKELHKLENRFLHAKKRRVRNKYKNMLKKYYPSNNSYWWLTIVNKNTSPRSYILGMDLCSEV